MGAIALGAVALWLALFLTVGGDFYRTVDEMQTVGPSEQVRVGGRVAPNTVSQDGGVVRFALEGESGAQMKVVYRGPYPDRLGPYQEVVVSGSTTADGSLEATQVLVRCPDKLFPEKLTNAVLTGTGLEKLLY